MQEPAPGIYTHFKGNRYEVLYIATHSETQQRMVVYRALYGDMGVWTRPISMWDEIIERDGKKYRRFAPEGTPNEISLPPAISDNAKADVLKRVFGYDEFRTGQGELIDAIVSGRDALGIMPTGSGKSICYQLPALMTTGTAIVVSPLISLMKDQVTALTQSGIPSAYLNSSLTARQFDMVLSRMAEGKYRLIYVAPERLQTPRFLEAVRNIPLSLIAVDEAHCLSQWGQDFRPSYLDIPQFIQSLPTRPPICAFTATATKRVRDDIIKLLQLQSPVVLTTGFDRPNLTFYVLKLRQKSRAIVSLVDAYPTMSGIIYCATRKNVELVHTILQQHGLPVARYHAGLSDDERAKAQQDFAFDHVRIIVATNAFGMGIDKSNVRFVIHYNMPKDIESYYQEAGRAGRDGLPADCILLFGRQDIMTQKMLINHTSDETALSPSERSSVRISAMARLNQMVKYCEQPVCLRRAILQYFNESVTKDCGHCGHCVPREFTKEATKTKALARPKKDFPDDPLFDQLRALRMRLAVARSVPAYVVFSDTTLRNMCAMRPKTLAEMGAVSGVGQVKLATYGNDFLQAILQHEKPMEVQ